MARRRKANLYLRGRIWRCWFRDHRGKQIRESTGQTDQALARQAALRIEAEYVTNPPDSNGITLEEALASYLADCERRGRAGETLRFYLRRSKTLRRLLGDRAAINSITMPVIEEYADRREGEILERRPNSTRAIATIGKELGLLRSALRHWRSSGDRTVSACTGTIRRKYSLRA